MLSLPFSEETHLLLSDKWPSGSCLFPSLGFPRGYWQVMFHVSHEDSTFKTHNPWPNTEYLIPSDGLNWHQICTTVSPVWTSSSGLWDNVVINYSTVEWDPTVLWDEHTSYQVYEPLQYLLVSRCSYKYLSGVHWPRCKQYLILMYFLVGSKLLPWISHCRVNL